MDAAIDDSARRRDRSGTGFCRLLRGARAACRLFLDSASTGSRFGRYSFLTADPLPWSAVEARRRNVVSGGSALITAHAGDGLVAQAGSGWLRTRPSRAGPAAVSGRRCRICRARLGPDARTSSGAAIRRSGIARPRHRSLRLGARVGSRVLTRVDRFHRHSRDVARCTDCACGFTRRVYKGANRHDRPRTLGPSHPRTLAPSHPRTLAPCRPCLVASFASS